VRAGLNIDRNALKNPTELRKKVKRN